MKNIREFFKVGFVKNRFCNKCAIVCASKNSSLLGVNLNCTLKGGHTKVAREGNNFADTDFLLKQPAFTLAEGATHVDHWNNSSKIAFTLAEVLITLGIIGVVAAMTMPSLVANYEKKRTATAVKKAYSELSQALKLAEVDYGDMEYWDYPDGSDVEENKAFVNRYITPYYKGVTMLQDGSVPGSISPTGINFISSNGTIFSGKPNNSKAFFVLVDINGFKRPNKMGTDIFYFATSTGKLMPDGWEDGLTREMILNGYSHNGHTYTCKTARSENDDATMLARHACTSLLMIDGWEFKKDYPWKYTGSGSY